MANKRAVMSNPPPVLLLDRQAVTELLTLDNCMAAVEGAFLAHSLGKTLTPSMMHLSCKRGEFHIKAGGVQTGRFYFACKINGSFFYNQAELGLPNMLGLIVLSDAENGIPLAVMESGHITSLRTGAATAIAAKHLARPESRTVTICGAGRQADIQLRALMRVLPIERAFIWSRSGAKLLAGNMRRELGIDVSPVSDLGMATRQSDVIVTCTSARCWFLGQAHVAPGTFVAAVGADSPDKQEIEPALLARAAVVPDLLNQAADVGDLHHAIAAGLMTRENIRGELGAVVGGSAPGRLGEDEITVFDSTGTALQDAATAAVVYERAIELKRGVALSLWNTC